MELLKDTSFTKTKKGNFYYAKRKGQQHIQTEIGSDSFCRLAYDCTCCAYYNSYSYARKGRFGAYRNDSRYHNNR